jgi:RNA-directed DNA polymerase
MELKLDEVKTVPISKEMVRAAYAKVRRGGKSAGIDEESWKEFDLELEKNLYVVWNRLASGSYHPSGVREAKILKKDGGERKLGIPTMRDRISQQVVKHYMEERVDNIFHKDSYGYRPMKSAHQALKQVKNNCHEFDWVIDMDITKFFDEIDHEMMIKAVEHVIQDKWVSMYVKRWLEAPIVTKEGDIKQKEGKGTPQGGVISPLLANLYLHFTLDKWLEQNYPSIRFVRYADDIVIHCKSKEEAELLLDKIRVRLSEVKLSVKESKTRIAYCKDYRRKLKHEQITFEFLGFSFKPIKIKSGESGKYFLGFGGDISKSNSKKIVEYIKVVGCFKYTNISLEQIAGKLNPRIRGWINYYSLFTKRGLYRTLSSIDSRILKWIKKKYKINFKKSMLKLIEMRTANPKLFYHWEKGISATFGIQFTSRAV